MKTKADITKNTAPKPTFKKNANKVIQIIIYRDHFTAKYLHDSCDSSARDSISLASEAISAGSSVCNGMNFGGGCSCRSSS